MNKKNLYLLLAVAGAIIPCYFFIRHFADHGPGLNAFLTAIFANDAASGFTVDLLISSVVFWIAIAARKRTGNGPAPWPFVILNLLVGLSCALPAYFYANELRRAK